MTLREQAVECAWHLLIIVGMSPFVFIAADFLRYGA
jgi:hypothetical protein